MKQVVYDKWGLVIAIRDVPPMWQEQESYVSWGYLVPGVTNQQRAAEEIARQGLAVPRVV